MESKIVNENPLVTIITATYNLIKNNRKEHFIKMVESVKNQDYPNIEHVIIDGGSDDGSIELFETLGLKYYSEPDNGIYDAFNKGIQKANGKYINFMNSDDYFNNLSAVTLSVKELEKHRADFSFAKAIFVDDNDNFVRKYTTNIYGVFSRMPFCHQTMFTRTDVLKKEGMFDLNFKSASDYDLIIRLMIKRYKYCEVKQNIVSFRTFGESGINVRTSILEQLAIFKKIYSQFANLTDKEYNNIIICSTIPTKLLLALGITNPLFYIINFLKLRKQIKKNFIQFKFSKDKGLEYFILFNKKIKPKPNEENNELDSIERFIRHIEQQSF